MRQAGGSPREDFAKQLGSDFIPFDPSARTGRPVNGRRHITYSIDRPGDAVPLRGAPHPPTDAAIVARMASWEDVSAPASARSEPRLRLDIALFRPA